MRRTALIGLALLLVAAPAAADSERHRGHRDREARHGHHDRGARHARDGRLEAAALQVERAADRLVTKARRHAGRVDRSEARALSALRSFEAEARRFRREVARRGAHPSRASVARVEDAFRRAQRAADDLRLDRHLRSDFRRTADLVDDLERAHAQARPPAPRHAARPAPRHAVRPAPRHPVWRHGHRPGQAVRAHRGRLPFWFFWLR